MNYSSFKNLLFFFVILFTTTLCSQKTWHDTEWNLTTKDNASFYRETPKKVSNLFEIVQYYKNGNIAMQGFSKSRKAKKGDLDGIVRIYYKTGELKEEQFYLNGKPEDIWKTFHKSGKIKTKGKYRDGEKVGVWKTFYKNVY